MNTESRWPPWARTVPVTSSGGRATLEKLRRRRVRQRVLPRGQHPHRDGRRRRVRHRHEVVAPLRLGGERVVGGTEVGAEVAEQDDRGPEDVWVTHRERGGAPRPVGVADRGPRRPRRLDAEVLRRPRGDVVREPRVGLRHPGTPVDALRVEPGRRVDAGHHDDRRATSGARRSARRRC